MSAAILNLFSLSLFDLRDMPSDKLAVAFEHCVTTNNNIYGDKNLDKLNLFFFFCNFEGTEFSGSEVPGSEYSGFKSSGSEL